MKSDPTLTLEDKKDFAKIALGDDISTIFFNSMDTDDIIQRHNDAEPLPTVKNMEFTRY